MRWRFLRAMLLTPVLVAAAMVSALSYGSVQAANPVPPANMGIPSSLDYSDICSGDTSAGAQSALMGPGFDDRNPAGDAAYVTSTKGNDHCTKVSVNGGPVSGFGVAHGGDLVTIFGMGTWLPNKNVQIWLSDGFPLADKAGHKWPATTDVIGPDIDTHRECRTVIKGNLANPVTTFATPQTDGANKLSFPKEYLLVPNVTETTFFNIRVAITNATCNIAPGAPAEEQGTDTLLIVQPFAPNCQQVANGAACLSVTPQVVYPGQPFTVSAQNLGKSAPLMVNLGVAGNSDVCVPLGALDPTANFSATFTAPPYTNLPLAGPQNGVFSYKVFASGAGGCNGTITQPLYVSPPTLNVPTQLTSGDKATFNGASWLSGAANSSTPQGVQIVAYVGSQSGFSCSKATTLNGGTTNDGSFALKYTAPSVNDAISDTVRVGAFPIGASLASACASFDDATCQTISASPASTCPLIAATAPLRIVPTAGPTIPWQVILLSLLLFLPLLPLFFWLGRRDEDEIIVTEQDVTVAREVLDASGSQRVGDATFARTIKVTRERVRLRDGKVLDEEVEEYDVYRDAQGREVRRLRTPGQAGTQAAAARPATA